MPHLETIVGFLNASADSVRKEDLFRLQETVLVSCGERGRGREGGRGRREGGETRGEGGREGRGREGGGRGRREGGREGGRRGEGGREGEGGRRWLRDN